MTQTFNEKLVVQGAEDTSQLQVQAHSTQTQPLQQWLSHTGTVQAQVTAGGQFQTGDPAVPDALIQANALFQGEALPATPPVSGLHTIGVIALTETLDTPITWSLHELYLEGEGEVSGLYTASRVQSTYTNNSSGTNAELRAGDFEVVRGEGTSALGQATGIRSTITNGAGGTVTKASGVQVQISTEASSSISEASALEVLPLNSEGTIETLHGLRIADMGASQFAIRTEGGIVQVGGTEGHQELRILNETPSADAPADFLKVYPRLEGGLPRLFAKDEDGAEFLLGGGNLVQLKVEAGNPPPTLTLWMDNSLSAATTLAFQGNTLTSEGVTQTWAAANWEDPTEATLKGRLDWWVTDYEGDNHVLTFKTRYTAEDGLEKHYGIAEIPADAGLHHAGYYTTAPEWWKIPLRLWRRIEVSEAIETQLPKTFEAVSDVRAPDSSFSWAPHTFVVANGASGNDIEGTLTGLAVVATNDSDYQGHVDRLVAIDAYANVWRSGTADELIVLNTCLPTTGANAPATTGKHIQITSGADPDSLINEYGLYIADLEGDNRWAICTHKGKTIFNKEGDENSQMAVGHDEPSSMVDVAGSVEVGDADSYLLGDPITNDTWRFTRDGNNLVIQRRESGAWVTKQTISA